MLLLYQTFIYFFNCDILINTVRGIILKQTIIIRNKVIKIDIGFILILFLMGISSLFSLYNAANLIKVGTATSYILKQSMWYIIGFGAMAFLSIVQNKTIFSYIKQAYSFLMIALMYLLASSILNRIIGYTLPLAPNINGAVSWFTFPLIGSFQPSEFIKIVLIIMLAQEINTHQEKFPNPTMKSDFHLLLKSARILLPPLILIFLQPDTGLCIIIAFNSLVLILCSGIRKEYIFILVTFVFIVLGGFFYLYNFKVDFLISVFSSYRVQRIEAWLDPESHILGSSNQLYTSLLSLGSAGLLGYGMQANIISIPEAQTDFIFAAIGQCFGFIGTMIILLLCLTLDLYLCKIAYNTQNKSDRLIIVGVIGMLLYQQIQNMGMICGLLPITGITLPLISYGGSSILSYFIAFSIVMNISPTSKKAINLFHRKK